MEFLRRTWAEIDLSALKHNFEILKNASQNSEITCVVKANAYGHSDNIVVPALDKAGCDRFAVSNIEEAIHIRSLGVDKPILILGYTPVSLAEVLSKYDAILAPACSQASSPPARRSWASGPRPA